MNEGLKDVQENLTQDEIESFHLSTLKLSYEEAVHIYLRIGFLIVL